MKLIDIIIVFIILFYFIKCTCSPEEENFKVRDSDDCNKRTFSEEEQNEGAYKCCLMEEKIDTTSQDGKRYTCIPLTHNNYDDIKDLIKKYEANIGVKKVKIKCKSSFIPYGFYTLFLLILALF